MAMLGVEPALYSILTYIAAARTLDFVIYGLEEYTAITIVSARSAVIRERIIGELERGVTVYKGYGGMSGAEQEILYCVVTRLEIGKVKSDRARHRRARLRRLTPAGRRRRRRRQARGDALRRRIRSSIRSVLSGTSHISATDA